MSFDPKHPHGHTTRDGRPARIVATNAKNDQPIVALYMENGREEAGFFSLDGSYMNFSARQSCPNDLINAPPRIKGFINIYSETTDIHPSRKEADELAPWDFNRIACIEIDVPHGHGLQS